MSTQQHKPEEAEATYFVTIGRTTSEYLDITVRAINREDAIQKAYTEALDRCSDSAWDQGDCDYFETGVEKATAKATT